MLGFALLFYSAFMFAKHGSGLRDVIPFGDPVRGAAQRNTRRPWWLVIAVGIAIGAFAFAGEMTEGGGHAPMFRLAAVAAVFIGLATSGALIAYAFLRKPLGLGA